NLVLQTKPIPDTKPIQSQCKADTKSIYSLLINKEKTEKTAQKRIHTKKNTRFKPNTKEYTFQKTSSSNIASSFGFNLCIHQCLAAEKHQNQDQPKCVNELIF
ncbi:hypothetical protein, partial [Polaribacter gangjinensis]